jgi:hypothetical protein
MKLENRGVKSEIGAGVHELPSASGKSFRDTEGGGRGSPSNAATERRGDGSALSKRGLYLAMQCFPR